MCIVLVESEETFHLKHFWCLDGLLYQITVVVSLCNDFDFTLNQKNYVQTGFAFLGDDMTFFQLLKVELGRACNLKKVATGHSQE